MNDWQEEILLLQKVDVMREALSKDWNEILYKLYQPDRSACLRHGYWNQILSSEPKAPFLSSEQDVISEILLAQYGFCTHHDGSKFDCASRTEDCGRMVVFYCKTHADEYSRLMKQRLLEIEEWKKARQEKIYQLLRHYCATRTQQAHNPHQEL